MTNSLMSMTEWIADEPGPVYLLGALPQGPHDQLGYIVPWHGAMLMPTGVYEFVERPDVQRARKLINDGGLWNTFIFGGNVAALLKLFSPRFDETLSDLRAALRSDQVEFDLARAYDGLSPVDFSQDVLARQINKLSVLRLSSCGWWPLKSPHPSRPLSERPYVLRRPQRKELPKARFAQAVHALNQNHEDVVTVYFYNGRITRGHSLPLRADKPVTARWDERLLVDLSHTGDQASRSSRTRP